MKKDSLTSVADSCMSAQEIASPRADSLILGNLMPEFREIISRFDKHLFDPLPENVIRALAAKPPSAFRYWATVAFKDMIIPALKTLFMGAALGIIIVIILGLLITLLG